jgi:antitoxin component of MazEF toxin-antitoxin module
MIKKIKKWGGSLAILFNSDDIEIYPFLKKGNFVEIEAKKDFDVSDKIKIEFKDKENIDWVSLTKKVDEDFENG